MHPFVVSFHNHRAVGGRAARAYSSHFIDEKSGHREGMLKPRSKNESVMEQ